MALARTHNIKALLIYRLMPVAVFTFLAVCFALHPQSPLNNGQLFDTDDYMRLNEVINWLQGASWFDLGHPRLSPGENPVVHWSRLVDVPLALVMLPLIPMMGIQHAALVAACIVPPLLFILLLLLTKAMAKPLIALPRNNLTALMVLFAPVLLFNFTPGRADHHAYQILIAGFGLFALQRMALYPRESACAVLAAVAFACGLWISPEIFPWLVSFCACLALIAGWQGGFILRNAAVFGISLPLAIAALMPIALRPADFAIRALSWFSAADLIFALLAGSVFVFGWLVGCMVQRTLRFALIIALGFCASLLFIYLVPDIFNGAYANYNPFFNQTLLNNINEAQPLWAVMNSHIHNPPSYQRASMFFLRYAFLPVLALIIIFYNLIRARKTKTIWLINAFFLLPALLLTILWQMRVGYFAQLFSIVPVTWFVLQLAGQKPRAVKIIIFLMLMPLPTLLMPAILGKASLYPDLALFPAARAAPACPLIQASDFLNQKYGDKPHTILSGTNEGPELLFRTKHNVLAAPYNVDANSDAFDFLNARSESRAREIIRHRPVDLILVCNNISWFYAGLGDAKLRFRAPLQIDSRGKLRIRSDLKHPAMIEKLVNGETPRWLKQVEIPGEESYLLFEIKGARD